MKLKLGDTIKGFKFSDGFSDLMLEYVGVKGKVVYIGYNWVRLQFPDKEDWFYPAEHPLAKPVPRLKDKLK